jgi:hypothetical protein
MVVSSDSMKNATATSQGRMRFEATVSMDPISDWQSADQIVKNAFGQIVPKPDGSCHPESLTGKNLGTDRDLLLSRAI